MITISYRVPSRAGTIQACRDATERLLREWKPVHWHMDSVSMTKPHDDEREFAFVTFHADVPGDWGSEPIAAVEEDEDYLR